MSNTKTFVLKLPTTNDQELFATFQLEAIFQGKKAGEMLIELIRIHNSSEKNRRSDRKHRDPKLVIEADVISMLNNADMSVTKVTLKKWRDRGDLVGPNEEKIWGSDGYTIVYDYQRLFDFVKMKKAARIGGANGRPAAATSTK